VSKLYDLRKALADAIIAEDMGFTADNTIILRRGDLWNDLATATASAEDGLALHIGIAEGAAQGDDGARGPIELTIPITILTSPQAEEGSTPEEDVWEAMVLFVCGLKLNASDHAYHEFRFKTFSDIEVPSPDGGTAFFGRQTVFSKTFHLNS
jgi:hypothetical protein